MAFSSMCPGAASRARAVMSREPVKKRQRRQSSCCSALMRRCSASSRATQRSMKSAWGPSTRSALGATVSACVAGLAPKPALNSSSPPMRRQALGRRGLRTAWREHGMVGRLVEVAGVDAVSRGRLAVPIPGSCESAPGFVVWAPGGRVTRLAPHGLAADRTRLRRLAPSNQAVVGTGAADAAPTGPTSPSSRFARERGAACLSCGGRQGRPPDLHPQGEMT
jgi:hypothetical protein